MSPVAPNPHEASQCFPRVSGDEPGIQTVWTGIQMFSPRERG